jgi:hypothetical protein
MSQMGQKRSFAFLSDGRFTATNRHRGARASVPKNAITGKILRVWRNSPSASGDGILKIGRKLGIGTSVVQRVFKQESRPS